LVGNLLGASQPEPRRYWPLQWTETGIHLVLALGLGGICYWRVRRLG
jgi:hypothetical protein